MSNLGLNTSRDRQLPTRVSTACERCRRNKSRCDPFRPCSLCVRANVECSSDNLNTPSQGRKRRRMQGPSRNQSQPSNQTFAIDVTSQDRSPVEDQCAVQSDGDPSRAPSGQTDTEVTMVTESRRPSVADPEADSAMGIAQKIFQLNSNPATTSAIPGGDSCRKGPSTRLDRTQRRPIVSILGYPLPPTDIMRTMMEEYFDSVHWFSLVIYEPRFRSKFESVQDGFAYPWQKGFLLLLSTVIGMGAWYKSHKNETDTDSLDEDSRGWALSRDWAQSLIQGAGSQLPELMDQSSIASVQCCILLGSYYVYHGKPNLAFALLGATIKTAQAIGLHRQPLRGDFESIEERKRVWWTIYTWDRFASVTYGRPLGINDKDCNVTHPDDSYESPSFGANRGIRAEDSICYSSYQRELNKIYLIASPIIETIFGIRTVGSTKQVAGQQYVTQVMEASESLWAWRRRLPSHLLLDLSSDYEPNHSNTSRVHRLQALSLHLTFDNLLIILHRPLLAQQVDLLMKTRSEQGNGSAHSPSSLSYAMSASPFDAPNADSPWSRAHLPSTEQWWDAALRTSKVTEMPQLAQLATDSHLVAFLAINLFNSAIVMAVLALSQPLSDRAQEVKRTITRIFRLQELLGKKTTLSMQSNIVLKDVIHMLLRRETEAMLAPVVASTTRVGGESQTNNLAPSKESLMSVGDTLRLPIQLPLNAVNTQPDPQQHSTTDEVLRVNESLASVQRVFPSSFDGAHGDNATYNEGWNQYQDVAANLSEGTNDAWLHSGFQNFNVDGDSEWANEESNADATGTGLYWFWDSTWS